MSPVPSFWMTCLQSFGPPEYEPWRGWPFRGVLSSTLWHGTMPWKEPYHPLAKHAVLVSETNSNLCITSLLHHAHICPQTRPRSNACGYDLYFSYPGFHRITDVHGCSCPQSDLWQFMCMVWVLPHPHLYPVGMRTDSPGPRCTPHRRTPMVGCLQMPREPSRRGIQWGRFSEVSEMDCSIRIIRPWHACTRCFFSTHCTMSSNVIQCHPMSSNVIQCHPPFPQWLLLPLSAISPHVFTAAKRRKICCEKPMRKCITAWASVAADVKGGPHWWKKWSKNNTTPTLPQRWHGFNGSN